jgi:hypothetical protein
VVTAAHCVTDEGALQPLADSDITVRLASDQLGQGIVEPVDLVVPHPDYDDSGGALPFDLAILHLKRVTSLTTVSLISPSRAVHLRPGDQAFIAGWGAVEAGSFFHPTHPASKHLKDALVRLESDSFCLTESTQQPFDTARNLCSTMSSGEACHGDSGGPLFLDLGYPRSELIGVIRGGERLCRRGHPNLYLRLSDGPMREWLDGQLAAASRPLVSCSDVTVRTGSSMVTIKHIRTNAGCATARTVAGDVSARDDCFEETSDGVNTCESGDFVCATELRNGPAGVAFKTHCESGTLTIDFQEGSEVFEKGPQYRISFGPDARPISIGSFDIAAGDSTLGDMIEDFGPPDTAFGDATACAIRWEGPGLDAIAVDLGTGHACNPGQGLINIVTVRSPRFVTDRGLSVGMSERALLSRYPRATTRGLGGEASFGGESFPSGELYSLHLVPTAIGPGGLYASLKALVQNDTISGLEVVPLLGGD